MQPVDTLVAPELDTSNRPLSNVADFDSVAIQRLISEVREDEPTLTGPRYDRTHNRHNR